uniref:Sulfotransfer_1 domain-containing protein n=1 Tax=Strongyloides papillosus TaxID=174720 RepID=A0A0N5B469_STREA
MKEYIIKRFCISITNATRKFLPKQMKYLTLLFSTFILLSVTELYITSSSNSTDKYKGIIYNKKVVREKYFIAPKYKLATCAVHKSFSAMLTSILCYLDMEKVFLKKFDHLADFTFKFKTCVNKKNNCLRSFGDLIKIYGKGNEVNFLKTWKVIMVVRNPIERFISGFVHICYIYKVRHYKQFCLRCGKNFKCFVNKLYNILTSGYESTINAYSPMKAHFYPQTMQCNYFKNKNRFVVLKFDPKNLDSFYKSLEEIFLQQNIPPEKVEYIDKEMRNYRISHSTSGKAKTIEFIEKFYKEKGVLKKLIEIFYYDFKEFEFDIPNV